MRLLAFLSTVEASLRSAGRIDTPELCRRHVDYSRGTARMHLDENRAVVLILFRLASGRTCLRVNYESGPSLQPVLTLYPDLEDFSWDAAADDVLSVLVPILRRDAAAAPSASAVNA